MYPFLVFSFYTIKCFKAMGFRHFSIKYTKELFTSLFKEFTSIFANKVFKNQTIRCFNTFILTGCKFVALLFIQKWKCLTHGPKSIVVNWLIFSIQLFNEIYPDHFFLIHWQSNWQSYFTLVKKFMSIREEVMRKY